MTVSHDRYFLDRICDGLFILQNQHLRYVNGGYSQNLDTTTKEEKEKSQGALAYKQSKQKKIKNLKEYLESVEFEDMGVDSIDFLIIVGNAAIQLNDNDSIELIKRYLKEINIEVPYYKFGLKELELELEKKSGKIMRLLNKLSPLKKYLILQPQLNGVGINVEKILEDLKK